MELILYTDWQVEKTFRWITHDGRELKPSDMETTHCFYSLRMVWNNLVPESLRVGKFKGWDLRHRSPYYWITSVRQLSLELRSRWDSLPV